MQFVKHVHEASQSIRYQLRHKRRGIKSHKVIDKEDIKENLKKEESEKTVENELEERQKITKQRNKEKRKKE
jgi:hypothetical protein